MWEHFSVIIPLTFLCVYQASIREPEDEGYDENSKSDSGSDPPSKPPSPPPEGANMIPGKRTYMYITYTLSIIMYFFFNCGDHEGTVMT